MSFPPSLSVYVLCLSLSVCLSLLLCFSGSLSLSVYMSVCVCVCMCVCVCVERERECVCVCVCVCVHAQPLSQYYLNLFRSCYVALNKFRCFSFCYKYFYFANFLLYTGWLYYMKSLWRDSPACSIFLSQWVPYTDAGKMGEKI